MNQKNQSILESAGIEWQEALMRFMNHEEMMMKFMLRFPQDPSYQAVCRALEQGDVKAAYEAAHALKGVAANLAMKPLYQAVSNLVEPLRAGQLEEGKKQFPMVELQYRKTVAALEQISTN